MGYLTQFTEHSGLFSHSRVSGEKHAMLLNNLTRLMNIKQVMISKCGASHSEIMLLFTALDYTAETGGNITVAETARRLDVSMPAVSRSLKGLSEKGLIERDLNENDRRSVRIIVTKAGEKKVREFLRYIFATLDKALTAFSDEEITQMIELQCRFVNTFIKTLKGEENVRNKEHH